MLGLFLFGMCGSCLKAATVGGALARRLPRTYNNALFSAG